MSDVVGPRQGARGERPGWALVRAAVLLAPLVFLARPAQACAVRHRHHATVSATRYSYLAETAWLWTHAPHYRVSTSWLTHSWNTAHVMSVSSMTCGCQQLTASFTGTPQVWPMQVRLPAHIHLTSFNGLLPDTPLVDYLRWRWSLNPARFDHYHPTLGPQIQMDQMLRQAMACTPPPSCTPAPCTPPPSTCPSTTPTTSVQGEQVLPPSPPPVIPLPPAPPLPPTPPDIKVPEPSSLAIGLVLALAACGLRRRG